MKRPAEKNKWKSGCHRGCLSSLKTFCSCEVDWALFFPTQWPLAAEICISFQVCVEQMVQSGGSCNRGNYERCDGLPSHCLCQWLHTWCRTSGWSPPIRCASQCIVLFQIFQIQAVKCLFLSRPERNAISKCLPVKVEFMLLTLRIGTHVTLVQKAHSWSRAQSRNPHDLTTGKHMKLIFLQLNCPDGQHNIMSKIFFKTPEAGLIGMLHDPEGKGTISIQQE